VVPRYLAVIGSLLDFAGPRIAGRFRKALFRPLSGVVAASLYRRVTGISRLEATLGGAVAGCLYRLTIYGLENLPKHGFMLVANHPCVFDIEGRVSRLSELWQMPLAPHDINDRID
jgi:hypothetical protein